MSTGQLGDEMDPNVPFRLNVSQYRRKRILEAIMSAQKEKKDKGQKILQAFKKQLILLKQEDKSIKGEDPNGNETALSQYANVGGESAIPRSYWLIHRQNLPETRSETEYEWPQ